MRQICAAALLLALLLPGCAAGPQPSAAPSPAPQAPDTVSFTDDLGRTLELPRPRRAAALDRKSVV